MKDGAARTVKGIKLGRVAQFGIVVKDAAKAMRSYSSLYGIGPWYSAPFPESEMYYRGKKVDIDIDIYLAFLGKVEMELIQVNGGDRNIYTDILEK
ncbi:MAG TPA: hypothetical protein ENN21_00315, partial [Spirochaetes bacterium]|nr:hypothetical protein [Spirochaetota bacterium]